MQRTFGEKHIQGSMCEHRGSALGVLIILRRSAPKPGNHTSLCCRMSSTIFPWCTEYEVEDLPDYGAIRDELKFAGDLARACAPQLHFPVSLPVFCVHKTLLGEFVVHQGVVESKVLHVVAGLLQCISVQRSVHSWRDVHWRLLLVLRIFRLQQGLPGTLFPCLFAVTYPCLSQQVRPEADVPSVALCEAGHG